MRSWEHRIRRLEKDLFPLDKEALLDQWIVAQNFPEGWTYGSIHKQTPSHLRGTCFLRMLKEFWPDKEGVKDEKFK